MGALNNHDQDPKSSAEKQIRINKKICFCQFDMNGNEKPS